MKCIIPLARGGGYDKDRNKTSYMTVIADKPLISYLIDQVIPLQPEEVIFILDHDDKQLISFVRQHYSFSARFVKQQHIKGSAHAIYGAKASVQGELLVMFGDTFFSADLRGLRQADADAVIWIQEMVDVRDLGVVFLSDGYASKLIEKPDEPVSNQAMIGLYYFKDAQALFTSIKYLLDHDIKTKESYQLTDALQHFIDSGRRVATKRVEEWIDADHGDGLFRLQRKILAKQGKMLGKTKDAVIIKPVHVGKGAVVEGSVIGPNVSIGAGARVQGSIIKDAIICDDASVKNASLERSVIGTRGAVTGNLRQLDLDPGVKVRLD